MKKIMAFAVAVGLMASMGTAAFADADNKGADQAQTSAPVTGTSTTVVEPTEKYSPPSSQPSSTGGTLTLEITEATPFYFQPEGKLANTLAPQTVFSTGKRVADTKGNGEWLEIYTWLGNAWMHIPTAK
ncbi:hypothetical protein [Paenibacillus azoreducens]|uniref:SH3 domain-containing protein n=1 Tax=Paenibacillus azoreducens TaxID=116718 RepID=A0A919YFI5_9BACL|nr:hypothetical protein [Paenibacillus azoreducens]GIO48348.1 hypothetical protein J34TS1_31130 [Paenibacillus azoreducens]